MVAAPTALAPSESYVEEASLPGDLASSERLRRIAVDEYEFVWRSLRRLGVTPPETDDAAQQVFIILAGKLANVEPRSERSYLFGIVMRVAANVRRARARLREVPEEEANEAPVLPAVETQLDRAHARAVLDEILASMPDERRAVFVLFELEELTLPEIAEVLDLPPGTVSSRLRRAREDMRVAIARLRARRQGV